MRFLYSVWLIIVCGLMSLLICRRLIPVSETYDGASFFTMQNGKRIATPLLLVLAVVELSDVVFAVDSIPAVKAALPPFYQQALLCGQPGFGLVFTWGCHLLSGVNPSGCHCWTPLSWSWLKLHQLVCCQLFNSCLAALALLQGSTI